MMMLTVGSLGHKVILQYKRTAASTGIGEIWRIVLHTREMDMVCYYVGGLQLLRVLRVLHGVELGGFEEVVGGLDSFKALTTGGIARLVGVDAERELFVGDSNVVGSG